MFSFLKSINIIYVIYIIIFSIVVFFITLYTKKL